MESFVNRYFSQRQANETQQTSTEGNDTEASEKGPSYVQRFCKKSVRKDQTYQTPAERMRNNPHNLFLVRGNDSTGRKAWYYLQVQRGKVTQFEKQIATTTVKLTEFGTIILSGYGENPPPDAVERMKREYDFEAT